MRPTMIGLFLVCLTGCVDGLTFDASETLEQAGNALARGDPQNANDLYTSVLVSVGAADSQVSEAYRGRGRARLELDRTDEAMEDFTAAVNRDPADAQALVDRAEGYRQRHDYPLVLQDLTAAIRVNPKLADAFIARGAVHVKMAAFAKAIADFDQAIQLGGKPDPKQVAAALAARAGAHKMVGTYDSAIRDYTRAIDLNPDERGYHAGRGLSYLQVGRLEEGIADLSRAGGVTIDDFLGHAKSVGEISFPSFKPDDLAGVPDSTLEKFAGFARVSSGLWANQQCLHLDGAQKLGFEFEAEKNEQHIREVYRSLLGVDEVAAEMFLDALRKIGVAYALDQSSECGEPSRRLVSDGLAQAVCLNVFFDGTQFDGCSF